MENIKVHFAISPKAKADLIGLTLAGANYMLFTAYPYIKNSPSDKSMKTNVIEKMFDFKHTILDSGLFTMMFGGGASKTYGEDEIHEWNKRIARFVTDNDIRSSIVECDCQKLISPEFAWGMREELRDALPDREIINVFHLEDGQDGFDNLVKFSDYIAISVPELRIAMPSKYKQATHAFARRAKQEKPNIKIHLLGCTELDMLYQNRFCTSADSSSWMTPYRFGFYKKRHVRYIREEEREYARQKITQYAKEHGIGGTYGGNAAPLRYIFAQTYLNDYEKVLGSQD